jgi:hypothetical protein
MHNFSTSSFLGQKWSYDITHGVHVYRFKNFNQLTRIREIVKSIMPLEATPSHIF